MTNEGDFLQYRAMQNTLKHSSMVSNTDGRNVNYTNRLEHATSTGIIL